MLFLVSLVVFGPKSFGRRGKWQSPPVTGGPECSKIWWGHANGVGLISLPLIIIWLMYLQEIGWVHSPRPRIFRRPW